MLDPDGVAKLITSQVRFNSEDFILNLHLIEYDFYDINHSKKRSRRLKIDKDFNMSFCFFFCWLKKDLGPIAGLVFLLEIKLLETYVRVLND